MKSIISNKRECYFCKTTINKKLTHEEFKEIIEDCIKSIKE